MDKTTQILARLTGVRIPFHRRQFKLHESHYSLESDVALQVLSVKKAPTSLRTHADYNPHSIVIGRYCRFILFMLRKSLVGDVKNGSDVVVFRFDLRVLYFFPIQDTCTGA